MKMVYKIVTNESNYCMKTNSSITSEIKMTFSHFKRFNSWKSAARMAENVWVFVLI